MASLIKSSQDEISPFYHALAKEIQQLSHNLNQIENVNNHLHTWNSSFVSLLGAMQASYDLHQPHLHPAEILQNPNPNPNHAGIPSDTIADTMRDREAPESPEDVKERKKTRSRAAKGSKSWPHVHRQLMQKLPRKSQSKEKLSQLEKVWQVIEDKRENGASLSEILKPVGCSVLQVNDCIATLIKVKVIKRRKTRLGNRYYPLHENLSG